MDGKLSLKWGLLLFAVYGCSLFYYQPPLAKFNHERHVNVLFEQQRDCTYCHKLPVVESLLQKGDDVKIPPELTVLKLKMDSKCHSCHKDEATKVAQAPKGCDACHENMKTMKPVDHVSNWKTMHAVPAGLDRKTCDGCHDGWYCESCHSQQTSLNGVMHSRAFKLKHSLEAMVDPGACDTCHRISFCIDCHQKERL